MHIRSALVVIKDAKYIGSILRKYNEVLAAGKYYLFSSFRAMSLNVPETLKAAERYFSFKKTHPMRIKGANLFNKLGCYINRNKKSTGEYEAFYVANNYDKVREVKLFSFTSKQILTICKDEADKKRQLDEYVMFSHAYNMPHVRTNPNYANAINVSMVDRMVSPGDCFALTAIAEATVANNPDPKSLLYIPISELISFSYENKKINLMLKDLADRLDDAVLQSVLPLCMQHGDLSKDNLIYGECDGKTGYWWIDWEHASERVFFYDYFFYIIHSAMYDDFEPISCYLSGENDETLKAFFEHFNISFESDKKWDYLVVFAMCFLKERVCDLGYVSTLEAYCELINKQRIDSMSDGEPL